MADTTVEFDVAAIVGGNADSIVAKLSDLSDLQLVELATAENGLSKPRATVLVAIEAEQKGRAEVAAQVDPVQMAAATDAAAAQEAKIAELENQLVGAIEEIENQANTIATLTGERDAALTRAANLEAALAAKPGTVAKVPKAHQLTQLAALPDLSDVEEVRVICVGEGDKSLPGISPLTFLPEQFQVEAAGLVLDAPIAFAREVQETQLHALYLIVDGKKGLRAGLVQPIDIGGGKSMELPRGHLVFAPTTPVAAPPKAA